MCGIVGYIGRQDAAPVVLEGLTRLEHRGYDSAGVAVLGARGIRVAKQAGRVRDLVEVLPKRFAGTAGIGHTRWATHGPATDANAHPHSDESGRVAVVHNGIIDNSAALRAELTDAGVALASDTDTEVLAHLVARSEADTLEGKVRDALRVVVGTYGLAVMHADFPDRIVAARNGSPLVVGVGDKEMYVASDLAAIVRHTTTVAMLDDGEMASVTAAGFSTMRHADLASTGKTATQVDIDAVGVRRRGPRVLHAQGDARAADHGAGGAARPARRALRHRAPGRPRHGRPRPARGAPREDPGLRLGLLRRPDGRGAHRGARPDPRRRRGRQRVPLPRPGHRARHPLRRGEPVGGDHRHPARRPGGTPQGRALRRAGQRGGLGHRARVRRRHLPPRRPRGGGREHQGADQHVPRLLAPRAPAGPGPRPVHRRRQAAGRRAREAARPDRGDPRRRGRPRRGRQAARRGAQPVLHRTRARLPGRAGGRAEVQGDQLPPRRGLPDLRAQARPARAHRPRGADGGAGAARRADRAQHRCAARDRRPPGPARGRSPTPRSTSARSCARRIDVPRNEPELDPILLTIPLQLLAYHAAQHLGHDIDKPRNLAKSVTVE